MNKNKITFFVPVLNEEHQIERCLQSIRDQSYDQNKIEIFLADAGCSDKTIEIARKFNITYFFNKKKLSEYAYKEAIKLCKGDFFVFFAADNELTNKKWVEQMILPFNSNPNIEAVYTHIEVPKNSPIINQYYSYLHVEPLTWFIYGDGANPKYFKNIFEIQHEDTNYIVYKFSKKNFPLIATAQGLVVKKSFDYIKGDFGDDILPLINLIDDGKLMAYVSKAGIYHHHVATFKSFFLKYFDRACRSLEGRNHGFKERSTIMSVHRKLKLIFYIPYALSIIFPLVDTFKLLFKHKNKSILLHVLANFLLGFAILLAILKGILSVKK